MYDVNPLATKMYLKELERQVAAPARPFAPAVPPAPALRAAVRSLLRDALRAAAATGR